MTVLRSRGAGGGWGPGRLVLLVVLPACYDGYLAGDTEGTDGTASVTEGPTSEAPPSGDDDDTEACVPGQRGCPCTLVGGCDAGLVCEDGTCEAFDPTCGDGLVEGDEQCDAGAALDDAGACKTDCTLASCGDGFVGPGEACDDGNLIAHDQCTNACQPPACGDGVLHDGEECDDGNGNDGDACTTACQLASCGDGIVWRGHEACDDGNRANDDRCTNACALASCGDGVQSGGEECDDGNRIDDDECSNACIAATCGDGVQNGGEECDDGNRSDADMCTNECEVAECGDGIVNNDEPCDDGDDVETDACIDCVPAECGDGHRWTGVEACDGSALGGATCVSEGFDGGVLGCTANCELDTSECVPVPA